jgi:hypothetical protein
MQPPEMRRLEQLEDENSKLKKIVADLSLDLEMLQNVIRSALKRASGRFARRASATVTGATMSSCVAKGGRST